MEPIFDFRRNKMKLGPKCCGNVTAGFYSLRFREEAKSLLVTIIQNNKIIITEVQVGHSFEEGNLTNYQEP